MIYTGLHQTPEQVVQAVVQEDADAVGLSLLSGAHLTLVPKIVEGLRSEGFGDVLVVCGGIIPDKDIPVLKAAGVAAVSYTHLDVYKRQVQPDLGSDLYWWAASSTLALEQLRHAGVQDQCSR